MAKKPVSLLHLHELFREVWDGRDKSKDDWDSGDDDKDDGSTGKEEEHNNLARVNISRGGETSEELGPGAMLRHQDNIFHPDNLVNRTRNFPTQANVRLMQLEAGERAIMGGGGGGGDS